MNQYRLEENKTVSILKRHYFYLNPLLNTVSYSLDDGPQGSMCATQLLRDMPTLSLFH